MQLPYNFNAPFRARSILDFWQRWHMTLARFLRDYVFFPLADMRILGTRHTIGQYVMAFVLTMSLCGLWHGAGWHYVLWGTLQGVAMVVALGWRRFVGSPPHAAGWAMTVVFFLLTAVIFRAGSLDAAWHVYAGLARGADGEVPAEILAGRHGGRTGNSAAGLAGSLRAADRAATPLVPIVLGVIGFVLLVQLGNNKSYDFIYFQF